MDTLIVYLILMTVPQKSTVLMVAGDSIMIYTDHYQKYKIIERKESTTHYEYVFQGGIIIFGNTEAFAYINRKSYHYKRKQI